jgi:multimeric flavodoxin WrbA
VFKDDFQEFSRRYVEADGFILGAPVFHMSVPASMKAALDRLSNVVICNFKRRGLDIPRFSKVSGAITVGAARYGGQEMVMTFLNNSSLLMNSVVVAPDSNLGGYIGGGCYLGAPSEEHPESRMDRLRSKDIVLTDEEGLASVFNLGKRVAEMTRIVRAGVAALHEELPSEYFYTWEEL